MTTTAYEGIRTVRLGWMLIPLRPGRPRGWPADTQADIAAVTAGDRSPLASAAPTAPNTGG
jgi:hypothetical protein